MIEDWSSLRKTYDLPITYFLPIFVQKHQRVSDLIIIKLIYIRFLKLFFTISVEQLAVNFS